MTRVVLRVTTRNTDAVHLGHVEAALVDALPRVVRLGPPEPGHRGEVPGREHVDQLMVGYVAHCRRPRLVCVGPSSAKEDPVEADERWSLTYAW
jgi:hypothetical protein